MKNAHPAATLAALAAALAIAAPLASAQTPKRAGAAPAAPAASAPVTDQADLDRSQIIGNRELPKVLYIVPWKKPGPGDLAGRPLVSVLDEALSPVDRDVFRRQVSYDVQMQSRVIGALPKEPASTAPSAATAPAIAPAAIAAPATPAPSAQPAPAK